MVNGSLQRLETPRQAASTGTLIAPLEQYPRTPSTFERERLALAVRRERELAIDDALAGSFPASDPPAWNPGIARPIPPDPSRGRAASHGRLSTASEQTARGTPGVTDASRPGSSEPTLLQALVSIAGAAGLALLVPLVVVLVGLPVALAGRGLLEVLAWLFPALR